MSSFAQSDSMINLKVRDSLIQQKPVLRIKQFIIPASMVGYGFFTLLNSSGKRLNQTTSNEIVEDYPFFNTGLDNILQYTPAAAVFGLNVGGIKGKNNLKDEALIYAMAMGINAGVVFPLKKIVRLERPDQSKANSFPSGHTSTAFVAAEFLRKEYGEVSVWYAIGGYAVATGTGVLRMLNNRHWLGYVVAGAGIGIASTKLAYFIHDRIKWKNQQKRALIIVPYFQNNSFGFNIQKLF